MNQLTAQQSFERLAEFPRARLFSGRTPLEHLPNLSRQQRATFYIKRDDCTELAFGGNKVRQLEFYLGDAQSLSADTVLITGAVQSNFARLAAAGARKLGMDCHIQLEERVVNEHVAYRESGNVLVDRLLGATLHSYPDGEDEAGADRRLNQIAERLRIAGKRPYIIPLAPGHPPLGALGYLVAARELLEQVDAAAISVDRLFVASGSGATHAGLLFGLRAMGSAIRVTGACVRRSASAQRQRIGKTCVAIARLLDTASPVVDDDIDLTDEFLSPGYGVPNQETVAAIVRGARVEGLILDPVYTGKAFAAMLHGVVAGENCVFVHTGGAPALFAYPGLLDDAPG